jgi:hypothetical protein
MVKLLKVKRWVKEHDIKLSIDEPDCLMGYFDNDIAFSIEPALSLKKNFTHFKLKIGNTNFDCTSQQCIIHALNGYYLSILKSQSKPINVLIDTCTNLKDEKQFRFSATIPEEKDVEYLLRFMKSRWNVNCKWVKEHPTDANKTNTDDE